MVVLQFMIVIESSVSFLVGSVINWRQLALVGKVITLVLNLCLRNKRL
jgi:hypothetical protein